MTQQPFTPAQMDYLEEQAHSIAQGAAERIREALKDRLTFTPEERQALALFRELDAAGRAKALYLMAADAGRANRPRPLLRIVGKGAQE